MPLLHTKYEKHSCNFIQNAIEPLYSAAGLAQLVEHLTVGREVVGLIPGAGPVL